MKKKSIILLILVSFWFGYSAFTVASFVLQNRKLYQTEVERRKKLVEFHLDNASHFLMGQKIQSLIPRLDKARELGEFDFYLLRKKNEVVSFYNKGNDLDGINHDYKITNQFVEGPEFAYKTVAIFDHQLTIGLKKSEMGFLWQSLTETKTIILQDLFFVTFMVFLIAFMILRDIIKISKFLQKQDRSTIQNVRTHSIEAETFLQATMGLEEANSGLRINNLLLASSLGPAIKAELKSQRTPPYTVPCTVVRVDMNGYTQMFIQKAPQNLFFVLNEYFKHSREIIERYHGLIYQYIGDEIIFICKSKDPESSSKVAVATVRSLFEAVEKIATSEVPQGLRLKASLVTGELHFVKLDQGHAFSGLPLIESVRMLGQVTEKAESRLVVYAESTPSISDLCVPSDAKTTVFKGFDRESHLLEIKHFLSVKEGFLKLPLNQLGIYYRSNDDLVFILHQLKKYMQNQDSASFFELVRPLWDYRITEPSHAILVAYKELLAFAFQDGMDALPESRFLATAVSLAQHLLTPEQIDIKMLGYFDRGEKATDPRVCANTVAVKSHFGLGLGTIDEKTLASSNRLSAAVILSQGKIEVSIQIVEKIRSFLSSPHPHYIASGLYIVASLFDHHRNRDSVYVRTNPLFQEMADMAAKFLNHPNKLVRNRAQNANDTIMTGGALENRG